jgi:hypothetical protein
VYIKSLKSRREMIFKHQFGLCILNLTLDYIYCLTLYARGYDIYKWKKQIYSLNRVDPTPNQRDSKHVVKLEIRESKKGSLIE